MESLDRFYRCQRFRYFGYTSTQQSVFGMFSASVAVFNFMTVFYKRNKIF